MLHHYVLEAATLCARSRLQHYVLEAATLCARGCTSRGIEPIERTSHFLAHSLTYQVTYQLTSYSLTKLTTALDRLDVQPLAHSVAASSSYLPTHLLNLLLSPSLTAATRAPESMGRSIERMSQVHVRPDSSYL
mgnify:CR=1 FL=1